MPAATFEEIKPEVIKHLQYLGYEVTEKDETHLAARHISKLNFVLKPYRGGLLLTAWVGCEEAAKTDGPGYLEYLNAANSDATAVRCYCDQDSDMVVEAWFCVAYSAVEFGRFMDAWHDDLEKLAALPQTHTYLK